MQRYDDIKELLEHLRRTEIPQLHKAYDRARTDPALKVVLRPGVKTCLEHLRSSLEYCAQDIAELTGRPRGNFYFPYGVDEAKFKQSLIKNLPGLDSKKYPAIFELVESLQAHKCGDPWLVTFCNHTNFRKHDRLGPQERVDSLGKNFEIGVSPSGSVAFQCQRARATL